MRTNIKMVISFFWSFIAIILFFQLLTVEEYSFLHALTYSILITGTFLLYVLILAKFLIRKHIKTKNNRYFIVRIFFFSIAAAILLAGEDYAISFLFNMVSNGESVLAQFFGMWMAVTLILGVAYAFELYHHHIEMLESTQLLKDSLNELEMSIVRQQLSPHFTFNILNNLQFLIQKNKEEALNLLAQYSKILRYYVHESQSKAIFLNDEISFLRTYLELEKDRLGEDAHIRTDIFIEGNCLKIPPFILSTFVENAFKHLSLKNKWVDVQISTTGHQLYMQVQNNYDLLEKKEGQSIGVGLQQLRKRLELVYAGQYELKFQENKGVFCAELKLNLNQDGD